MCTAKGPKRVSIAEGVVVMARAAAMCSKAGDPDEEWSSVNREAWAVVMCCVKPDPAPRQSIFRKFSLPRWRGKGALLGYGVCRFRARVGGEREEEERKKERERARERDWKDDTTVKESTI